MKIVVIGDPHGVKVPKSKLKKVNYILITGDVGKADLARKRFFDNIKRKEIGLEELPKDSSFLKKVYFETYSSSINVLKSYASIAPTFSILGNVGNTDADTKKEMKNKKVKLPLLIRDIKKVKNLYLVKNRVRKINGLRVGFLEHFTDVSWVKEFKPQDYFKTLADARAESKKAKNILKNFKKVDVLVCHAPPYGVLDKVSGKFGAPKKWWGKHAGSKVILEYIKKKKPRYVFCGHIHEGKGKQKVGETEVYNVGSDGEYVLLNIK